MRPALALHGYWRSGAAYRVRIALALKEVDYAYIAHDLRTGAQRAETYRAVAPQALVPALATDEGVITQSLAILEWIDERFPHPALIPANWMDRALVRSMAQLVACDIHPLGNLRVLNRLREQFEASQTQVLDWIGHWISLGFEALETQVERHGDGFAFGDAPTIADCCLIPQLYSAERFSVDLAPFPRLRAIGERAATHPAFQAAHPSNQPDYDPG